ncbi:MAG TPA: hypothetical protein VGM21_07015 [Actinomycetota bacterium]
MTALAALWGAGVGLGLVAIIAGLRGAPPLRLLRWVRPGPGGAIGRLDRGMLRLGLAVGAGVLVGELLGALARAARDDATMRLRVEAGRARTRTSARVVVGVTLAMAVGLVVLNRGYLAPYDSAFGQLILAGVGGLFGTAFWWLARMARVEAPQRLLGGDLEDGTEGVAR